MKLYKFRALKQKIDFERLVDILESGKFWCSKFYTMNDPMEGIYLSNGTEDDVAKIFSEKNNYLICSFTGEKGLLEPLMWGYYANGFKGVAIEVTIDESQIKKFKQITYRPKIPMTKSVLKILTTKLCSWCHEDEWRYFCQDSFAEKGKNIQIGKITGIYLGRPYKDATNSEQIISSHNPLKNYYEWQKKLKSIANDKNIFVKEVKISSNKVRIKN